MFYRFGTMCCPIIPLLTVFSLYVIPFVPQFKGIVDIKLLCANTVHSHDLTTVAMVNLSVDLKV